MGKTEWDYWTSADTLAEAPPWAAKVARKVLPALKDRMRTVAVPAEVVPGIRLIPAFGHTPGHVAVEITSDGEQLIYFADTALHPIHLEFPHWVAELDQDAEGTMQTRRKLFQRAAERKQLVLLFHFTPFPSLGYIVARGDAWRWQPASL
jgi:glyoxylase-like metal-dependent hydrolase (beta-lactamase superfamily II)